MKFVVIVEGQTEKDSIGPLLRRFLEGRGKKQHGVRVVNIKNNATSEL